MQGERARVGQGKGECERGRRRPSNFFAAAVQGLRERSRYVCSQVMARELPVGETIKISLGGFAWMEVKVDYTVPSAPPLLSEDRHQDVQTPVDANPAAAGDQQTPVDAEPAAVAPQSPAAAAATAAASPSEESECELVVLAAEEGIELVLGSELPLSIPAKTTDQAQRFTSLGNALCHLILTQVRDGSFRFVASCPLVSGLFRLVALTRDLVRTCIRCLLRVGLASVLRAETLCTAGSCTLLPGDQSTSMCV